MSSTRWRSFQPSAAVCDTPNTMWRTIPPD